MITFGDFDKWCTQNLHRELEKVINANQWRRQVYYLLVIVRDGYEGPPAGLKGIEPVKTIDLSGKKVIHTVIEILSSPPLVPMIGSLLWGINNRIGLAKCLYCLPPNHPTIGPEGELESELVAKSAKGMPIVEPR